MYINTIGATMSTAAIATIETVDTATTTRASFPTACEAALYSVGIGRERYGCVGRSSWVTVVLFALPWNPPQLDQKNREITNPTIPTMSRITPTV